MLKATIDTSIIVRMVLGRPNSLASKVFAALRAGQFTLILSPQLLQEISHTLASPHLRQKHLWGPIELARFMDDLRALSVITPGALTPDIPLLAARDPGDLHVVGAAVEGGAALIVSQDQDLLTLGAIEGLRIVELPELYALLRLSQDDDASE